MAEKNEEKTEKKQPNKALITILIAVLMGVCAFGGWSVGASKVAYECITENQTAKDNQEKTTREDTKDEITTTQDISNCETRTVVENAKPRCYGIYSIEGTDGNQKWRLKEDGTWQIEGQEKYGIYYITDNTITFVESYHVTGPDQAKYHSPVSHHISEDCKKITFTDSSSHSGAGLVKISE